MHCKQTFNAKTTVTRFCGKLCNKRFTTAKQRNEKIEAESLKPIILSAQTGYSGVVDQCVPEMIAWHSVTL